jgi:hypothetical protein
VTATERPELARPPRFSHRLSFREFLRMIKDSSIATWPDRAFDDEFWERRILWRRTFVANSPSTVGHVLLDNAENYVKSNLARRLLEPGNGGSWRRRSSTNGSSASPGRSSRRPSGW